MFNRRRLKFFLGIHFLWPLGALADNKAAEILKKYTETVIWIHEAATADSEDELLSDFSQKSNAIQNKKLEGLLKELEPFAIKGDELAIQVIENTLRANIAESAYQKALDIAGKIIISGMKPEWINLLGDQITNNQSWRRPDANLQQSSQAGEHVAKQLTQIRQLGKKASTRQAAGEELFRIFMTTEVSERCLIDVLTWPTEGLKKTKRRTVFSIILDELSNNPFKLKEIKPFLENGYLGKEYDYRIDYELDSIESPNLILQALLFRTEHPDAGVIRWLFKNRQAVFSQNSRSEQRYLPFLIAALKSSAFDDPFVRKKVDQLISEIRDGKIAKNEHENDAIELKKIVDDYGEIKKLPSKERLRTLPALFQSRLQSDQFKHNEKLSLQILNVLTNSLERINTLEGLERILFVLSDPEKNKRMPFDREKYETLSQWQINQILDAHNFKNLPSLSDQVSKTPSRDMSLSFSALLEARNTLNHIQVRMRRRLGSKWAEQNPLLAKYSKEIQEWEDWISDQTREILRAQPEHTLDAWRTGLIRNPLYLKQALKCLNQQMLKSFGARQKPSLQ